jgi:hypothetical protein
MNTDHENMKMRQSTKVMREEAHAMAKGAREMRTRAVQAREDVQKMRNSLGVQKNANDRLSLAESKGKEVLCLGIESS